MGKKKVCKSCKIFVEENECPICKNAIFSNTWKGRIAVLNTDKSNVGKKIGVKVKGEYAIKI